MTATDRALQFRQVIADVDSQLAQAIIAMLKPIRARYDANPQCPRADLLRAAKAKWINDIPTLGCLRGPTPLLSHKRLHMTETRVVATTNQDRWYRQEGGNLAIGLVQLELDVRPGHFSFQTYLTELIPLTVTAEWFAAHDGATDADYLRHLARRISALESLHRETA